MFRFSGKQSRCLSYLQTDYHSVGSRAYAYLELSVYIAQYEDYKLALIDHLTEKKVGHWDLHVRELAAKALNRLSSVAPSYLAESVMLQLLKNVEGSDDLFLKHGSILAIGELSLGLSIEASKTGESLTKFFGENAYLGYFPASMGISSNTGMTKDY